MTDHDPDADSRPASPNEYRPGPLLDSLTKAAIAAAVSRIIDASGEDPFRDGLRTTPTRVANLYDDLLIGYTIEPATLIGSGMFEESYSEMVIVTNIEFYSLCEHHMLPFFGRAHVAYLPDRKVIGLSTIPRIVDAFARRLQIQERLTRQVAELINDEIQPKGVGVVIDGMHLCLAMRGEKLANPRMRTSMLLGRFRTDARTRAEFLEYIGPAADVKL